MLSAASDQLYRDFLPYDKHPELPVFDGELPMDLHGNGCYTSQAAMKLYNRQNEHLGDAAERMAVMADWLGTRRYPRQLMTDTWRRVIWHQFETVLRRVDQQHGGSGPSVGYASEGNTAGGI